MTGKHSRTLPQEEAWEDPTITELRNQLYEVKTELHELKQRFNVVESRQQMALTSTPLSQPVEAMIPRNTTVAAVSSKRKNTNSTRNVFLIALIAFFAMSASLANWAQSSLVDEAGFRALTAAMAENPDLKQQLQNAVKEDIMSNSAVKTVLGDGSGDGLRKMAHDKVEELVVSTVGATFEATDFRDLWKQVMDETHEYNFAGPDQAALDLAPVYNAVIDKIDSSYSGFISSVPVISGWLEENADINFQSLKQENLPLPIELPFLKVFSTGVLALKTYAGSWMIQAALAVLFAAILAFFTKTKRIWWFIGILGLTTLLLWAGSAAISSFTLPSFGSETAKVLGYELTHAVTDSAGHDMFMMMIRFLAFTLVVLVAAITVTILNRRGKVTSPNAQKVLKALG